MQKIRSVFLVAIMGLAWTVTFAGDDTQDIRSIRMQSNQAIERHDAEALKALLADDFVISISTGVIERSRDEHVEGFASHFLDFPDVIYIRTPTEISVSEFYPLAIEHGTWVGSRTTENGKLENGGEYTAAWKKTDGVWQIYSELFVGLYCRGEDC